MQKKPDWFRIKYTKNRQTDEVAKLMNELNLNSVCQSAHCPNCSECWSHGTASFMILGEYCTRGCRFCAVKKAAKPPAPDPEEPEHLAKAVSALKLNYVVITSVTRDDMKDGGAGHFADCVAAVRKKNPKTIIETLIPDFHADESLLRIVADSRPDVISHNIETVERLTPQVRDPRAGYRQSLDVLKLITKISKGEIIAKSGMMVGMGETDEEVIAALEDVSKTGAEIMTIGQYLSPGPSHLPVKSYVSPEKFSQYQRIAYSMGFRYVASGPLVRSSYKAGEPFIKDMIKSRISH